MNLYALTDESILLELGKRIAALRLRKNVSQEAMASAIGIGRLTYRSLESGKGTLATLVGALRYMESLESLDNFLPPIQFSPIEAHKLKGKTKQRATKAQIKKNDVEVDW